MYAVAIEWLVVMVLRGVDMVLLCGRPGSMRLVCLLIH